MTKPRIGIIVGTTRGKRFSATLAAWFEDIAVKRDDMEVEVVDLRDYALPLLDEDAPPAMAPPQNPAAQRWNAKLDSLDGFVFLTAEYNHGVPGVLKNAIDYSFSEFYRKPAAFVGYGGVGGARSVSQLRGMLGGFNMAPLGTAVHIAGETFMAILKGEKTLADFDFLAASANGLLDELSWWATALKTARDAA